MKILTADDVRALLDYDEATGVFTWRHNSGRARAGARAGCDFMGYVRINVCGKAYLAHRLAFLLKHGRWPIGDTDHINQNRADNRIENLREATRGQNKMNCPARRDSRTGCRGITPRASGGYQVRIQVDGVRKHIGYFSTMDEAARAYDDAAKKYWGNFSYRFAEAA